MNDEMREKESEVLPPALMERGIDLSSVSSSLLMMRKPVFSKTRSMLNLPIRTRDASSESLITWSAASQMTYESQIGFVAAFFSREEGERSDFERKDCQKNFQLAETTVELLKAVFSFATEASSR